MEDFWYRVRDLITKRQLKLVDIERDLDLPHSTISIGTVRKSLPRAEVVLKLADYFGVTIRWLMTGQDESSLDPKYVRVFGKPEVMALAYRLSYCTTGAYKLVDAVIDYDEQSRKR